MDSDSIDQLNTHQSETLVRFVAAACGGDEPLGIKGQSGRGVGSASSEQPAVLAEALAAARALKMESERAKTLAALAPHLPT